MAAMPPTEVVLFADRSGRAPVLEWLDGLPEKVRLKFIERVERLAHQGHSLRRPLAGFLRDGVYELRVRHMRVNYRLLYSFHGQRAVLCHGLTKERKVPNRAIDLAIRRRADYRADPQTHTYREEASG